SHGWDHRRVHRFTPATFREDIRRSKESLEQAAGSPVVGYRAPTFSVMRGTGWAIDVLADAGMTYDSSVFPVRHDRYGVPAAPRPAGGAAPPAAAVRGGGVGPPPVGPPAGGVPGVRPHPAGGGGGVFSPLPAGRDDRGVHPPRQARPAGRRAVLPPVGVRP